MNDNELLERFLAPERERVIDDNGFTLRLMQELRMREAASRRMRRMSRLWTVFCIAVAAGAVGWLVDWSSLHFSWHGLFSDMLVFAFTLLSHLSAAVGSLLSQVGLLNMLLLLLLLSASGLSWVVRRARLYM